MAFTCPRCRRTSHNPNDEEQGYCGHCRWWTGDAVLGLVAPPQQQPSDNGPVAVIPHLTGEELDVLRIELDIAISRWNEVLGHAQSVEVRASVLRRALVLNSLRTAFEEARMSLEQPQSELTKETP